MKFAKRLANISASPTMAVMQEAQRLKSQGIDVIDLGLGEPDFATPETIKQAGIDAIREDFTKYTSSAGIQELRQAVADQCNSQWGTEFSVAHVVISCGAKHSIYNLCMAIFEEGDEVLLPAPYWVTFPEAIKITGARPREVVTPEENEFILRVEDIEGKIASNTRGLIVNTPNNPTGAVIPGPIIGDLVDLARSRGIFMLFDECYDYFVYGHKSHVSAASFVKPSDDFIAIVGSMSKTYSMTGWRIGYCIAHPTLIKKITEFQSHQTGNPTSISQKAALFALQSDREMIREMRQEYERRREFVLRSLEEISGFSSVSPDGAFYMFPNVAECMREVGIATSEEFAKFLIQEARVATVPGSAFGMEGYIRISYATSMDNLKEAFTRIKDAVSSGLQQADVV
ncbi:pyridoxal phosphate-dependent aminotransferase [Acidobacteria bacterium AH-259-D05]|nr:pyridoxal phosphate-dependent aminotransferase [Acidobacteria bacterium AH-259-D05]